MDSVDPYRGLTLTPDQGGDLLPDMQVAVAHDRLPGGAGAFAVVQALHTMFPRAPIFTAACSRNQLPRACDSWDIRTSALQAMPWTWRTGSPVRMAAAFESFDLSGYDLVISSSSGFAHGVLTSPHAAHVCYMHSPLRAAWSPQARPGGAVRRGLASRLRLWDTVAAGRVDLHVASCGPVAAHIEKRYRRPCETLCPPAQRSGASPALPVADHYTSLLRPGCEAQMQAVIEAFGRLRRPLKVLCAGGYVSGMRRRAGTTVEFIRRSDEFEGLVAVARAYIGVTQAEFDTYAVLANQAARPVIARAGSGAADSQVDGSTGVLYAHDRAADVIDAVLQADRLPFHASELRFHAARFGAGNFRAGLRDILLAACGQREFSAIPRLVFAA